MIEEDFKKGGTLFGEKKYYEAVQVYASLAARHGASPADRARALSNISACYASLKEFDKALASAEEAVALDAGNVKYVGRVATALEGLQRYEEAVPFLERVLAADPGNAAHTAALVRVRGLVRARRGVVSEDSRETFYYNKSLVKGKEAMQSGHFLDAIRHFGKAVELFPKDAPPRERAVLLSNRSAAYYRAGRMEESADDALLSTSTDEGYARGYYRLACAKHQLKKDEEAYDALQHCLQLEPEHSEAKTLMATVEPVVVELRKTAAERAADEARRVEALQEQLNAERAAASKTVVVSRGPARAGGYVYCSYCNETNHTRAECPLRRRKRARSPVN